MTERSLGVVYAKYQPKNNDMKTTNLNRTQQIPTQVKNPELVKIRRRQIVDAAVGLFVKQGFHKSTTRQIAKASGLSIGSLYEYVASKEDILYMVCDAIHSEMETGVAEALERAPKGPNMLGEVIREFLLVCNRMNDHILLIYQETQSLPSKWRKIVLENEVRVTGIFSKVLTQLMDSEDLQQMDEKTVNLISHNISVIGHMWTFRRWFLANHYSIEEYIALQTRYILGMCGVTMD